MLRLKINDIGVIRAMEGLMTDLTSASKMGAAMRFAASAIWIPNIEERLFNTDTSRSNYKAHLNQSMSQLSPKFVNFLGNASGWADVMEWERRVPGGYKEGQISEAIAKALDASQAVNMGGVLAVGIGELSKLNNLFPQLDGTRRIKLWQILQHGTGTFAGGGKILRVGKQVFFNDGMTNQFGEHGILAYQTTQNPGLRASSTNGSSIPGKLA